MENGILERIESKLDVLLVAIREGVSANPEVVSSLANVNEVVNESVKTASATLNTNPGAVAANAALDSKFDA